MEKMTKGLGVITAFVCPASNSGVVNGGLKYYYKIVLGTFMIPHLRLTSVKQACFCLVFVMFKMSVFVTAESPHCFFVLPFDIKIHDLCHSVTTTEQLRPVSFQVL